ncbi:Predicted ATP-binding protein involved in virulence [Allopseudospirillum japonicum]|uniref:Predicted ATP-binding protein involved in virulence n=1 Tax=Allopseudospirillum japonicum TaxID=64971 RepID=A0A1H6SWQ7_9GAMM|nr:AAA family ATPase [Allopseudospirillum japonicum]SEI71326.1 Predicted ATP-binding protein involved in virulence [Allopseudospirillum japonicum]
MEIKRFRLTNLGRFSELEAELAPTQELNSNVTVFIGNNGAGKTSILKALATSLSWFVARLRSEKGSGSPIPEGVILNGQPSALIDVTVLDDHGQSSNPDYRWSLAKTQKGKKNKFNSNLNDASRLADDYRAAITHKEQASLPLIAFYPVERVVLDIPLKIKERHSFGQLDGYDNSLNQGVDFRRFFEWFREREDAENETGVPQDVLDKLLETLGDNHDVWHKLQSLMASSRDRQLTAVRTAISNFMPGFSNLRVRRKPRLHMSIDKNGQTLNVLQLSQGEKSLMALVGDVARRLAMMNPALENPLHGDGIVLIDEVDMHLHPTWQRSIIERLTSTFPNCQLILTTHSPLVISDYKNVLVYSLDDGEVSQVPSQYGEDANSVLLNVMDTHIRNAQITTRLSNLRDLIEDGNIVKARSLLAELETELPTQHLELSKSRLLLRKEELRRAKN